MFLLNGTEFQLALVLGPISHLCIFIHGELNNYAAYIAAFFFLVYLSTVVIFYLSEPCIIANIVKASILISTYLLALGGSILIYRALFHRLRQFPGDIFDSLSKWGAVMKAQRNAQYFLELRDLHKKYGDYVRIGPSELSINNASAVQALHSSQCTKGPWYDLGGTNVNIHRTRDRKIHDRQRVFWDKAASGNALQQFLAKIDEHVKGLVNKLDTKQPINISTLFETSAFELMASLAFSEKLGTTSPQGLAEILKTLHTNQRLLIGLGHVPWIYTFQAWFPLLIPSTVKFRAFATEMINRRRARTPSTPDLFSYLLQAEESKGVVFPVEWEARLSIVAGSINDSALLTAIAYYLATDSNSQAALRAELTPLLTSGTFDPRQPLPFLDATINESLRLQPSIPSGTERLTPPSGLYLSIPNSTPTPSSSASTSVYIPGNTIVRIPNYTICRDARYFVEPNAFIPERWTTNKEMVRDGSCFVPFGLGPYVCAGKQLGLMKVRAMIAGLVVGFEWKLADGRGPVDGELLGKDEFTVAFEECWVDFKKI